MAKTDEKIPVEAVKKVEPVRFPKDKLLKSRQYKNRQDALSFLLKDGNAYTLEEVDRILADFMKGKVN